MTAKSVGYSLPKEKEIIDYWEVRNPEQGSIE